MTPRPVSYRTRIGASVAIFLGVATTAFASSARADVSANEFARPGAYLGAALGIGLETFTGAFDDLDFETSYGADVWAGYRVSEQLAFEIEVQYLPGMDLEWSGPDFSYDNLNFTANAKGYLLSGRFQPYGLVGLGGSWYQASFAGGSDWESGFAMRFGGGLEAYATRNIAAVAQVSYMLHMGNVEELDFVTISLGAVVRF